MIEIPIKYHDGIEKLCTQIDHSHPHIGSFWLFMIGVGVLLAVFCLLLVFLDRNDSDGRMTILKWGLGFISIAALAFVVIFAANDHGTSKLTITNNYPAFKHSNLTVHYDGGQHGKITVDGWGYTIDKIDWTNMDKLVIKPTNKIGKATNTLAKFMKKHKYNDWQMHVNGYRATTSNSNIYGNTIYSVYTKNPNKVVKKVTKYDRDSD